MCEVILCEFSILILVFINSVFDSRSVGVLILLGEFEMCGLMISVVCVVYCGVVVSI